MSFNDLAPIYSHFQNVPPGCLNPTDRAVIIAIARWPDGCYIGAEKLALQVGTSVGNLQKVLRKVRLMGIVTCDQSYACKNNRQRYRVTVSGLDAYSQRVSVKTPFDSLSVTEAVMGSAEDVKGVASGANGYREGHPYKEDKQYKNDKDEKLERFNYVIKDLPLNVKALINYGSNISAELDNLEHRGISLEAIKGALEATDFSKAEKVGGLFLHTLKGFRDRLAPTVEKKLEPYESRKCDICVSECKGNMPLDLFNEGVRCDIESESMERVIKQRNGLEP